MNTPNGHVDDYPDDEDEFLDFEDEEFDPWDGLPYVDMDDDFDETSPFSGFWGE